MPLFLFVKVFDKHILIYVLVINKNTNNTWILTLNELKTLSNPTYLFRCISDYNKIEKVFIASDLSSYTERYNQFLITETTNEILTSGTVNFNPTGFWSYEVYEQTSTSNLNYQLATNTQPIEKGRIKVIGTDSTIYRHESANTTYKGYGNGEQ